MGLDKFVGASHLRFPQMLRPLVRLRSSIRKIRECETPAFLILLFLTSPAFCFELRSVPEVSPTAYLRWDISKGPIRISLDSKGSADVSVNAVESSLKHALTAW